MGMGNRAGGEKFRKKVRCGDRYVVITKVEKGTHAGSFRLQSTVDGKWKVFGVFQSLKKAETRAREIAFDLAKAEDRLAHLTTEQVDLVLEFLASGMTSQDIQEFKARTEHTTSATLADVLNDWYDTQTAKHEYSADYLTAWKFVKTHLAEHLTPDKPFNTITTGDLEAWLDGLTVSGSDTQKIGPKRYKNLRGILVTIWKWASAEQRAYAAKNYAINIETPRSLPRSGGHEVLTPAEFSLMLEAVSESYLPWLSISGFAGLRQSEICGTRGRAEDRLKWEDFDWAQKRISVRPETSKTRLHRHVPICDALMQWLKPWRNSRGFVHNGHGPTYAKNKSTDSQTKSLGRLIGGWRSNCLRASRASYRLAQTNDIGLTAMEDGHTEQMLRKNYLNPRFAEDAELWFSLTPNKVKRLNAQRVVKISGQ